MRIARKMFLAEKHRIFRVAGSSQVIHVSAQRIGMIPNGDDARKIFPHQSPRSSSTTGLKYMLIFFIRLLWPRNEADNYNVL